MDNIPNDTIKIGLIGGMGPAATAHLLDLIREKSGASVDQAHVPLMVLNDTLIPDRSAYVRGEGPTPLPRLLHNIDLFKRCGITHYAMVCNSAHMFSETLKRVPGITLIDMVDETLRAVNALSKDGHLLLATEATIKKAVYQRKITDRDKTIIHPDHALQETTHRAIYLIKEGASREAVASSLIRALKQNYPDGLPVLILGCTELCMLEAIFAEETTVVSSLSVLADSIIDHHKNRK